MNFGLNNLAPDSLSGNTFSEGGAPLPGFEGLQVSNIGDLSDTDIALSYQKSIERRETILSVAAGDLSYYEDAEVADIIAVSYGAANSILSPSLGELSKPELYELIKKVALGELPRDADIQQCSFTCDSDDHQNRTNCQKRKDAQCKVGRARVSAWKNLSLEERLEALGIPPEDWNAALPHIAQFAENYTPPRKKCGMDPLCGLGKAINEIVDDFDDFMADYTAEIIAVGAAIIINGATAGLAAPLTNGLGAVGVPAAAAAPIAQVTVGTLANAGLQQVTTGTIDWDSAFKSGLVSVLPTANIKGVQVGVTADGKLGIQGGGAELTLDEEGFNSLGLSVTDSGQLVYHADNGVSVVVSTDDWTLAADENGKYSATYHPQNETLSEDEIEGYFAANGELPPEVPQTSVTAGVTLDTKSDEVTAFASATNGTQSIRVAGSNNGTLTVGGTSNGVSLGFTQNGGQSSLALGYREKDSPLSASLSVGEGGLVQGGVQYVVEDDKGHRHTATVNFSDTGITNAGLTHELIDQNKENCEIRNGEEVCRTIRVHYDVNADGEIEADLTLLNEDGSVYGGSIDGDATFQNAQGDSLVFENGKLVQIVEANPSGEMIIDLRGEVPVTRFTGDYLGYYEDKEAENATAEELNECHALVSERLGYCPEPLPPVDGYCFVAGTPVLTSNGHVAIEDVRKGDKVRCANPQTETWTWCDVDKRYARAYEDELIQVEVVNELIETTLEHPFWIENEGGRWIEAQELSVGDELLLEDGGLNSVVTSISRESVDTTVYNLDVNNWSTYTVGDVGVLVHNADYDAESDEAILRARFERAVNLLNGGELENIDDYETPSIEDIQLLEGYLQLQIHPDGNYSPADKDVVDSLVDERFIGEGNGARSTEYTPEEQARRDRAEEINALLGFEPLPDDFRTPTEGDMELLEYYASKQEEGEMNVNLVRGAAEAFGTLWSDKASTIYSDAELARRERFQATFDRFGAGDANLDNYYTPNEEQLQLLEAFAEMHENGTLGQSGWAAVAKLWQDLVIKQDIERMRVNFWEFIRTPSQWADAYLLFSDGMEDGAVEMAKHMAGGVVATKDFIVRLVNDPMTVLPELVEAMGLAWDKFKDMTPTEILHALFSSFLPPKDIAEYKSCQDGYVEACGRFWGASATIAVSMLAGGAAANAAFKVIRLSKLDYFKSDAPDTNIDNSTRPDVAMPVIASAAEVNPDRIRQAIRYLESKGIRFGQDWIYMDGAIVEGVMRDGVREKVTKILDPNQEGIELPGLTDQGTIYQGHHTMVAMVLTGELDDELLAMMRADARPMDLNGNPNSGVNYARPRDPDSIQIMDRDGKDVSDSADTTSDKWTSSNVNPATGFGYPFDDALTAALEKAPLAKVEVDALADQLAATYGGTVAKAPIKSRQRAAEKIANDYGGDVSRIKDLVRNTIIVDPKNIDNLVADLRAQGADIKTIKSETDPLGYSGYNTTMETSAGVIAEIQVNTPAMIFAKGPESLARQILGNSLYDQVDDKIELPDGMGHTYYEQWRVLDPDSAAAQAIAEVSINYYNEIRAIFALL